MNVDKEIIRRLKVEVADLEEVIRQKDEQILRLEEGCKMLIAAALKYGTVTGPVTMELAVPLHCDSRLYTMQTTNRLDTHERIIRVRRSLTC